MTTEPRGTQRWKTHAPLRALRVSVVFPSWCPLVSFAPWWLLAAPQEKRRIARGAFTERIRLLWPG